MERRQVLGIVGGVAVTVTVPPLPRRGRIGLPDLDRLRGPLRQLNLVDDQLGGVALAAVASWHAGRLLNAVEKYEMSTRVETALYALAGEYLATAGWFAIDANDVNAAGSYLDQALRAASISRDPLLQAQIWNCMAMRARQARTYTEAHAVAKAGLHSPASRANAKVRALFHARVAHGHAFRGEHGQAVRSLGRARDALARADETTITPPWLAFVNTAEIEGLAAIAFNALGYPKEAEKAAEAVLLPPTYVRNRAHVELHLAEARFKQKRIEQATYSAFNALKLATGTRGGLRSGRLAQRLMSIRGPLARSVGVPLAAEWVAAYDTARRSRSD